MGYMVRLGLWGAGTSFLDFRDFLGEIFFYWFHLNAIFSLQQLCNFFVSLIYLMSRKQVNLVD